MTFILSILAMIFALLFLIFLTSAVEGKSETFRKDQSDWFFVSGLCFIFFIITMVTIGCLIEYGQKQRECEVISRSKVGDTLTITLRENVTAEKK